MATCGDDGVLDITVDVRRMVRVDADQAGNQRVGEMRLETFDECPSCLHRAVLQKTLELGVRELALRHCG